MCCTPYATCIRQRWQLAAASSAAAGTQATLLAITAEPLSSGGAAAAKYQGQWQLVQDLQSQERGLAERKPAALRQVRNSSLESNCL
jgi:hypothetical protein